MKLRLAKAVRAAIPGLLLAWGAAACAFHPPTVEVQSVRLGSVGFTGGTIMVDLLIDNPNRFALTASELRYDLEIGRAAENDWVELISGVFERELTVPARDSARVSIPVDFTYEMLGGVGTRLLRRGSFDYRARGEVDARTPVGRRAIPFRHQGTVELLRTQ